MMQSAAQQMMISEMHSTKSFNLHEFLPRYRNGAFFSYIPLEIPEELLSC